MLVNALEYGGASAKALEPLLQIGSILTDDEMQNLVVPTLVKLFASTDRAMRIPLLERLPGLVDHLTPKTVNEGVFQNVALGFVDTSPIVRELTVKAIVPLAPKLSGRTMSAVLHAFAKLQLDEEAHIRANTTICLGKIASYIDGPTREKALIAAFVRALKDPFPPGRNAGLLSLAATQHFHTPMDVLNLLTHWVAHQPAF